MIIYKYLFCKFQFTETQEPQEEDQPIEEKKLILKERYAVFSLENVDPSNCWKKNSSIEMDEGDLFTN